MKRIKRELTKSETKQLSKNFAKFILSAHYMEFLGRMMQGKLSSDRLRMKLDGFLKSAKSLASEIDGALNDNEEDELYNDVSALDLLIELGIAAEHSKQSFEFKNDVFKLQAKYLKNDSTRSS